MSIPNLLLDESLERIVCFETCKELVRVIGKELKDDPRISSEVTARSAEEKVGDYTGDSVGMASRFRVGRRRR
jgi:hypothetical protein